MFPPFQQEIALHYLRLLTASLDAGDSSMIQLARESEERKNQGIMLGCLVCCSPGSCRRQVLFCGSGIAKELVLGHEILARCENFILVPPLADSFLITEALAKNDEEIHSLTKKINLASDLSDESSEKIILQEKRKELTDESLKNVFSLYSFTRFDGKKITLNQIIEKYGNKLPPTGTGDCCTPKLLNYAFSHALIPISMAEIFYGESRGNRICGKAYAPCDERCGYILPEILGLEILYRDKDIVVVNKEAGLLSVPGKGEDKADCAESRIKRLFPAGGMLAEGACMLQQPAVHRLDMETSGILILALNKKSHAELNRQFASGLVHKKYTALLDGILRGKPDGHTELRFRLDIDRRPYQIYDEKEGKLAVTEWHKCGVETYENPITGEKKKLTRIDFYPKTGRTHQLRLAAADSHGLALPIVGDSLYGKKNEGERLMLHSCEIEFYHPRSQKKILISCPPPF